MNKYNKYNQLQESYQQGYYDIMNESAPGFIKNVVKNAIKGIRGVPKRPVRLDIPKGVTPARFNWGSNQGWQAFLNALEWVTGGNLLNSSRYRLLVSFITNPTVGNLQLLNQVLGQWGIVLRANNNGILELQGVLMPSNPNYPWMSAIRDMFMEWNIPWPPPGS